MTEQEAKTKWCPMVKALPLAQNQGYIGDTTRAWNDKSSNCVASDCMMWVPTDSVPHQDGEGSFSKYLPGGHCGLTGKENY